MSTKACSQEPTEDDFFNNFDAASANSEYKYENLKICKTEDSFLGMGSYGAVYKAMCDELPCAAKILHLVHLPLKVGDVTTQKVIKKFDMECRLLSHIRHPNIVQYLGTCRDPDTNLPVLVMELMDEGLTTFLENSVNPLQYHVELNLCHDVALALAYLHRHGIIHRDLSSNNVLLIAGSRAKVTDFGMCKLVDVGTRSSRFSQTYCPGTEAYMAPETLRCPPDYTEKIDCFAFGVLVIQILTRLFPDPGPRSIKISDPLSPTGSSERPVLEVERRRSHIEQISSIHPLVSVATECLNYHPENRPTARHICDHLTDLKKAPQYLESHKVALAPVRRNSTSPEPDDLSDVCREIKILRQKIETLQHQLHMKEQQLLTKDGQLAHLAKAMMCHNDVTTPDVHVRDEHPMPCEESDSNLHATLLQREKEIENLRSSLTRRDSKICEIQQQLKSMAVRENWRPRSASVSSSSKRLSIETRHLQMDWKSVESAPRKMALGSVAVDGPIIYIRPSLSGNVYAYDSDTQEWVELPPCPCYDFAIVMAGGLLTAVGGNQSGGAVSTLLSLTTCEDGGKKWTRHYPPMATGRYNSAIVSSGEVVVVVGGYTRPIVVSTVDILDTKELLWYSGSNLPIPLSEASATIYNDRLFVVGGWTLNKRPNKSVFSCVLSDLVSLAKKGLTDSFTWEVVTEMPVYNATCATVCGRLIVFGGLDSSNQPTNTVRVYNSATRCFESCGKSLIPRYCCIPAPLPHSRVMIVGGYTDKGTTSSVEVAKISIV